MSPLTSGTLRDGDTKTGVFLDYQVIDHLQRIRCNQDVGSLSPALIPIATLFAERRFDVWMSEISRVEMVQGLQNPALSEQRRAYAKSKDDMKLNVASELGVRWLTHRR